MYKKLYITYLLLPLIGIAASCSKNDSKSSDFDFGSILDNISGQVITADYSDLNTLAGNLNIAVQDLQANPSGATLDAARQAWRDCRMPWEQSEGFLFGPVETRSIDPAIDSWPVNTVDLDAVMASSAELTVSYVDGMQGNLKGFHTIEYLLWGSTGNKSVTDFTAREYEYLLAVTGSLQEEAVLLFSSWDPAGENFGANLSDAGKSNSIYPSQRAAMQELVNGMIGIADEVANGKINDPFSQQNTDLEESHFSNNSKADFANNITSIQNLYTGAYGGHTGDGMSKYIASLNPDLDAQMRSAIQGAIDAINAIPGNFSDAITDAPEAVSNAQMKVHDVLDLLQGSVKPLIDTPQ